jgi:hypothetical protein
MTDVARTVSTVRSYCLRGARAVIHHIAPFFQFLHHVMMFGLCLVLTGGIVLEIGIVMIGIGGGLAAATKNVFGRLGSITGGGLVIITISFLAGIGCAAR